MIDFEKIFSEWNFITHELSPQEKGRLIDMIVAYANNEDQYNLLQKGNERFVFTVFQSRIDSANNLSNIRSNARKTNKLQQIEQTLTNSNKSNKCEQIEQTLTNLNKLNKSQQTEQTITKPNKTDTDPSNNISNNNILNNIYIDKEIDNKKIIIREREGEKERSYLGDFTEEELNRNLEITTRDIPDIERVCRFNGMQFSPADEQTVRDLLNDHSAEDICKAITIAKEQNVLKWSYIKKVLANWKGGITDGRCGRTSETGKNSRSNADDEIIARIKSEYI